MLDRGGDDVLSRRRMARTVPRIARLSASVPPLRKTISLAIAVAASRGYLAARDFQPLLGHLAVLMDAGRVSIHFK